MAQSQASGGGQPTTGNINDQKNTIGRASSYYTTQSTAAMSAAAGGNTSITSAGGPGGDGSNNSSHGGSGGGGSGGRQQQLVAFRRIANYLDISTPAGTLHSAIPAWILSSAWCILRIAVAAHGYVGRRTLYKYTDRPVYDYAYIYQIIAASLLQVAVLHHIWIFFHRREQFGYATTAVYIQGIVSGSIMVYADRLMYGTGAIVSILPILATLFGGHTLVVGIGWFLSTAGVVLMILADTYFPAYIRFEVSDSPIITAVCYVGASFLIMSAPQLYQYWLHQAQDQQEELVKFTTEIAELLVGMRTDRAMKAIEAQEQASRIRHGGGGNVNADGSSGEADPSAVQSSSSASILRTAATLRKLTLVLNRYRSYLPSSLFVEGAQDFGDDDDDDDDGSRGPLGEDHQHGSGRRRRDGGGPSGVSQRHGRDTDDDLSTSSAGGGGGGRNDVASGGGVTKMPLDPSLFEKSTFRRRWSTILYVSVVSDAVADSSAQVQHISERFCAAVIPRVVDSRGVIDRLGPTSILASFNCHTPCVIHESEAANCALGIAAELSQYADIPFAIVIASGYNFIGTCGVDMHRAKVVLGESVDLVHRLLPLASCVLACRILITEDTANKIGQETAPIDSVQLNPFGSIFVRDKGLTLYELRSARKENTPQALAMAFTTAFAKLRTGDYVAALGMLSNYIDRNPTDIQARRIAALCEPLAKERALLLRQLNKQSLGSIQNLNVPLTPYLRRELQWETSKAEEIFVEAQKHEIHAMVVSSSSGGPVGASHVAMDLTDTVRLHFQSQKLDYQEDGLVSMFLPADDDDGDGGGDGMGGGEDGDEQRPDEHFTQEDALSTEVPRTFEDSLKKRWRRSQNQIGEGAFAQLYLALGELGDLVAMKCFFLASQRTQTEELIQELNTLSSLRNDYIVGYVGYAVTPNHFIILMEYVSGGSLLAMLQQFGPLPLEATKRYVIDILKGLRYLHDHHVTHCDIKPHNALLANDGTCKLSDFGSSVNNQVRAKEQQEQEEAAAAGHQETMPPNDEQLLVRGTSWYLSPEAAKGEIRPSNDIWSLGITLIEMLTGKVPWTYRGSEANFIIMLGKDETMVPPLGPELPEEAKVFVRLCFERDPEKRPTAQLLLQHPFLT